MRNVQSVAEIARWAVEEPRLEKCPINRTSKHRRHTGCRGAVSAVLVLVASLSGAAWAITNPYVRNPVGSGTVPQSSIQGDLVRTPNPIDTTGNLIMTGNVREGRYFRGPMPYRSTTGFGTTLGSSSLDTFLRDSAGAEDIGGYAGGYTGAYRPFYSPSGTVAAMEPGYAGVFTPTSPRIVGRVTSPPIGAVPDSLASGSLSFGQALPGQRTSAADMGLEDWRQIRTWPMARTPREMEDVISDELGAELHDRTFQRRQDQGTGADRYRQQMQEVEQRLKKISDQAAQLKQDLGPDGELARPSMQAEQQRDGLRSLVPLRGDDDSTLAGISVVEPGYSERQIKPGRYGVNTLADDLAPKGTSGDFGLGKSAGVTKPDQPSAELPQLLGRPPEITESGGSRGGGAARAASGGPVVEDRPSGQLPALDRIRQISEAFDAVTPQLHKPADYQTGGLQNSATTPADLMASLRERFSRVSGTQNRSPAAEEEVSQTRSWSDRPSSTTPAGTGDAADKRPTFASFAQDKYERYIKAGDSYMKQARFYRAADAYTLASLYKPDDPLAYAGKSHALFAAGEYLTSALFLARCLDLLPEYMLQRTDLIAIAGGPGLFENRLADLEQCAKTADAPELQLLLSYVYYRVGQFEDAKKAIDAARKLLGDMPAVNTVKKAVDGAMGSSGTK